MMGFTIKLACFFCDQVFSITSMNPDIKYCPYCSKEKLKK